MCRRYALDDVRFGRAIVNYGDVGQGLFYGGESSQTGIGMNLTHAFAKQYNEKDAVYPTDYTPTIFPMTKQSDNALADIVVPEWKSSQGSNFTACDITFIGEKSAIRCSVALVVPMQLYYGKIEPFLEVYTVADASGLVPAFQKYFYEQCSPKLRLSNIVMPEPLITLLSAAPIEHMSIEDIVRKAKQGLKKEIVISPEHVAQMYAHRVPASIVKDITSNVTVYGPSREYYSISIDTANSIIEHMQ